MFDTASPAPRRSHPDISPCPGLRRGLVAALAACIVSVATIAFVATPSHGEPLSSIQGKLNSVRSKLEHVRGREQVLTSDVAALSGKIRSLEREIGTLRTRESRIEQTLAVKRAELASVRSRYQREHQRYLRLRRKLRRAQAALANRLVAIYKSDPPDFVTVILNADGFRDLLERADYLSRIGKQDSGIVERVRELKEASARKRELLLELRQRAQEAVEAIEARRRELQAARTAVESRQGDLASSRRAKQSALGGVRATRTRLEGDLAALEAASVQVTHQLRGSGPLPAGPIKQGSGGYIWPVNGPVVSPFGMRWGRLHAGVDISVPSGTPIRAAASGRVAIAGWVGGYGNYTCIQHGGGIATCYAHQASIGVSVGQTVRQGQVIGTSDCTGHCFGPHLHFEVRVNGTPVDPMGYL